MTDQNEKIDTLIMETVSAELTKTAVIIAKVFDACEAAELPTTGKDIAERLYILIDNGRIEAKGNMRRWRDSEVKLIA